jgi:hypothetical protein
MNVLNTCQTICFVQMGYPAFVAGLLVLLWSWCSAPFKFDAFLGGPIEDEEQNTVAATVFFNLVLLCSSGYMAMSLSSWTLAGTQGKLDLDRGPTSMWMKMSSQWLCTMLYAIACLVSLREPKEFSIMQKPGFF